MKRQYAAVLLAALTIAGCGRAENAADKAREETQNMEVRQLAPESSPAAPLDTETRLEELARSVPQVQDAKCVIMGKTAIVGITAAPGLDRSRVNVIKYSVAEAFRKDPEGINAFVTADMALGERIQHLREDIRNGKPFSGFAQELGDIIGRVAPQLPKDIAPMEDGRGIDANENQFQNNNL